MMDHESEIRQFIADQFLFGDIRPLSPEESLLEAGIIDSTGVLELLSYLEDHFGIKVQDEELLPENLDTIGNICRFLDQKLA